MRFRKILDGDCYGVGLYKGSPAVNMNAGVAILNNSLINLLQVDKILSTAFNLNHIIPHLTRPFVKKRNQSLGKGDSFVIIV